jgi:hypothetical protein
MRVDGKGERVELGRRGCGDETQDTCHEGGRGARSLSLVDV